MSSLCILDAYSLLDMFLQIFSPSSWVAFSFCVFILFIYFFAFQFDIISLKNKPTIDLQCNLKSGSIMSQALVCFSGLLRLFRVFVVPCQFQDCCSISVKNVIGILIGIALNLSMVLGIMDNLILSIFSIHEYGKSFYCVFSVSFVNVLQ